MNLELLHNSRCVRQQLQESPRWTGKTSIRDAVEFGADNLRQLDHEMREMSGEFDRD